MDHESIVSAEPPRKQSAEGRAAQKRYYEAFRARWPKEYHTLVAKRNRMIARILAAKCEKKRMWAFADCILNEMEITKLIEQGKAPRPPWKGVEPRDRSTLPTPNHLKRKRQAGS
jgi:hypothetical protein